MAYLAAVEKTVAPGHSFKYSKPALDREDFDLVLMDVQMPEMGGLEATVAIRERGKSTGDHLPIVAMTASAMRSRKVPGSRNGRLHLEIRSGSGTYRDSRGAYFSSHAE